MDPEHIAKSMYLCTEEERAAILKDSGLTETSMVEAVDAVMDWFKKQPHLVAAGITRRAVELYILASKGSIERCKAKIDNFYKWRYYAPEFIQDRQNMLDRTDIIRNSTFLTPIPKLYGNKRIYVVKMGMGDNFDLLEHFQMVCWFLDLRLKYDYMMGDIAIVDFENKSWVPLLAQNPLILKKMSQMYTKSSWRLSAIHVINVDGSATVIQRIFDFFKQFISSLIMDRLIIHASFEELHKHVPKESLPEDYGGQLPSMMKYREIWSSEFKKSHIRDYLIDCCNMVSDEKLRPRDENDTEEFLAGSFRKLEVD